MPYTAPHANRKTPTGCDHRCRVRRTCRCKGTENATVDITVIDRTNHHLFQPLLYQVATAGLSPGDIAHPTRSILRSMRNVHVVLDEVFKIDPPGADAEPPAADDNDDTAPETAESGTDG